jgi:hypothetical protein
MQSCTKLALSRQRYLMGLEKTPQELGEWPFGAPRGVRGRDAWDVAMARYPYLEPSARRTRCRKIGVRGSKRGGDGMWRAPRDAEKR